MPLYPSPALQSGKGESVGINSKGKRDINLPSLSLSQAFLLSFRLRKI